MRLKCVAYLLNSILFNQFGVQGDMQQRYIECSISSAEGAGDDRSLCRMSRPMGSCGPESES